MEYHVLVGQLGAFFAYQDPNDSACANSTKYPDNVPIMQFTGLLDKNGKEIYEGDIVADSRKGEVYWDEDSLQYWIRIEGTLPNVKLCTQDRNQFSIIGNIYETPELLPPNHPASL